jgi:hypothetical protein
MLFFHPSAPANAPIDIGFQQSILGETRQAWREGPGRLASCARGPAQDRALECTLSPTPLGGKYLARDLTFTFTSGRLTQIRFLASIDAYDRVRAGLDEAYGPPTSLEFDTIKIIHSIVTPHVAASWRRGPALIIIHDPETDGVSLSVTYSLDETPKSASRL